MCYELYEKMRAEEEAAKRRAQEMIDKARTAKPQPAREVPVARDEEKEVLPA